MSDDRRRPAQYASARADRLRSWLPSVVRAYSRPLQPVLERHGIDRRSAATEDRLRRLPVVPAAELGDGRAHVLEPTVDRFGRTAPVSLQLRFLVADVLGRRDDFARRHIDPQFRPVVWTATSEPDGPFFVAHTPGDLDRLANLGRRAVATSGIRIDDRVVVVDDGSGSLASWQFVLGCRDAGVAVLRIDPTSASVLVEAAQPSVLAGAAGPLAHVVDDGLPPSVRSITVIDGGSVDTSLPVSDWLAPAVVRAAWVRCPGGTGYHTWPEDEIIEVVDDDGRPATTGRLVWSAVGWHGSVWLRVDTGLTGRLDHDPCHSCGRTTPRVVPA